MKSRVKYLPQYPLSAASSTNTTNSFDAEFVGQKKAKKAAYIRWCTYAGVILGVVALITCSVLFVLILSNHASSPAEGELLPQSAQQKLSSQAKEIEELKDQLEFQNQRLHRMQKELQFMASRQKTQEAKEDGVQRLERLFNANNRRGWTQFSALAVDTPMETFPAKLFADISEEDDDEDQSDEDALIIEPINVVDVNQLPLAPANKRRGGSKMWPSLPISSLNNGDETQPMPALPELPELTKPELKLEETLVPVAAEDPSEESVDEPETKEEEIDGDEPEINNDNEDDKPESEEKSETSDDDEAEESKLEDLITGDILEDDSEVIEGTDNLLVEE